MIWSTSLRIWSLGQGNVGTLVYQMHLHRSLRRGAVSLPPHQTAFPFLTLGCSQDPKEKRNDNDNTEQSGEKLAGG